MRKALTLTAILVLAAGAASAWDSAYTETFDQTYSVDHGVSVGLDNINGDVVVEVWDRPEVRIYAEKSASSAERLELLEIQVRQSGGSLYVETHYPNSRDLRPEDRRGSSKVEYTLTVPRFAEMDGIEMVNGDLRIDGVEGGISAETVNGMVAVRGAAGEIDVETVNGDIELRLGAAVSNDIDASSVNGRIEIYCTGSADVRAETVNGRLSNDVGIEVRKGRYVGASMNGTIGGGGPVISMETVNGAIYIGS